MTLDTTTSLDMPTSTAKTKVGFSKYDFVKVRVYLSNQHYYVLSRFLICRVLTAVKVYYEDAVRMALELKKQIVDSNTLELTQSQLEKLLFDILLSYGYGMTTIVLYRMVSKFHHHRIPLIILVGGTCCTGKSTLATYLAERLNLPSVFKTDVIYEMIMSIKQRRPLWLEGSLSPNDYVRRYEEECEEVARALEPTLRKCIQEGKSIIVEGLHVSPLLLESFHRLMETTSQSNETWPFACQALVIPFRIDMPAQHDLHLKWIRDWIECQPQEDFITLTTQESIIFERAHMLFDEIRQAQVKSDIGNGFHRVSVQGVDSDSFMLLVDQMHDVVLQRMSTLSL